MASVHGFSMAKHVPSIAGIILASALSFSSLVLGAPNENLVERAFANRPQPQSWLPTWDWELTTTQTAVTDQVKRTGTPPPPDILNEEAWKAFGEDEEPPTATGASDAASAIFHTGEYGQGSSYSSVGTLFQSAQSGALEDSGEDPNSHSILRARSGTNDEARLLNAEEVNRYVGDDLEGGQPGEIRCLSEVNLQRLDPPFLFRSPELWPPGFDHNQYETFREVCAFSDRRNSQGLSIALPNANCRCRKKIGSLHSDFVPMICPRPRYNDAIHVAFLAACNAYCSCGLRKPSKVVDLYRKFRRPKEDDPEDDEDDDIPEPTGLPKGTSTMRNGLSFFVRGKTYEVRYPNWLKKRLNSPGTILPAPTIAPQVLANEKNLDKNLAGIPSCTTDRNGQCYPEKYMSLGDAIPEARCGDSCTSNSQCASSTGSGCSCVIDPTFHQANTAGTGFRFPPALCLSIAVLTSSVKGSTSGRLGGRSAQPFDLNCHCNATYASTACCVADDGLVWEPASANMLRLDDL